MLIFMVRLIVKYEKTNEACCTVIVEDCFESGFVNCTFNKSPGFNVATSNTLVRKGTDRAYIKKDNFEVGTIDDNGLNAPKLKENCFRSINFIDITSVDDYYMVGMNLGYHGYPYLILRLYHACFYDRNFNFIEIQKYNLQYYNYDKPTNAAYAKIVIFQEEVPTHGNTDFNNAVAFLATVGMPRKCFFKNCKFEDNLSTGLAMCGGEGWLLEGNSFDRNSNGRMPSCDIDWEDGWENMHGDIVKNNIFNSRKRSYSFMWK